MSRSAKSSKNSKRSTKGSKGAGRPSKYNDAFCKIATQLARLGLTGKELAATFDVSESTFHEWMLAHPEFAEAVKNGRVFSDAKVAQSLFERACGYEHPAEHIMQYEGAVIRVPYTKRYPPDTLAGIFWMRNRRRADWSNNPDPAANEPPPTPVKIVFQTVDARKRGEDDADA